jgi:putative transposase
MGLSKSQVSVMAKELDTAVEAFGTRPLDGGPYTFVAADALVLKVREDGRVFNVHALIAVGVNAEGYREILGLEVTTAEDGAGWLTYLRSPPAACPGSNHHQRRPRRAGVRDRRYPARSVLATVPHPLRHDPDGGHAQILLAVGAHTAALGVRSTRR